MFAHIEALAKSQEPFSTDISGKNNWVIPMLCESIDGILKDNQALSPFLSPFLSPLIKPIIVPYLSCVL